ncbi:glycosyltransferase family 4 protein [Deinococcus altitudinis]|uniref:glycosyltransferase family 4 protein n=1 Tax=Deinococcus altitudinis TaxID=468914 RepID=UPI0038929AAD
MRRERTRGICKSAKSTYDALILIDHYLPGIKAGGPVTSIENLVTELDDLKFLILTKNFDIDGTLYDVNTNQLVKLGNSDVIYLREKEFKYKYISKVIIDFDIEFLYINSFFSISTIEFLLKWFYKRKQGLKIVLAPRGQFSPGALNIRSATKKKIYLAFFRVFYKNKNIIFQATSDLEKTEIINSLGYINIFVTPNIPSISTQQDWNATRSNRIVFLSRISPKKNLIFALDILKDITFPVTFDIYGFIEDNEYWKNCLKIIADLPEHIKVNYMGILRHDEVVKTLSNYSLFLFPTFGENYGHVIYEALSAGCPIVITETTPWHDIEAAGVGKIIPLGLRDEYVKAIKYYIHLEDDKREEISQLCYNYATYKGRAQEAVLLNHQIFAESK